MLLLLLRAEALLDPVLTAVIVVGQLGEGVAAAAARPLGGEVAPVSVEGDAEATLECESGK